MMPVGRACATFN